MPATDTTRRLKPATLDEDETSYNAFTALVGYQSTRAEASVEAVTAAYEAMRASQAEEDRLRAASAAAIDAARLKEWTFHNSILLIKDAVRAHFGADSPEIQAVGLKKKSERKRPVRAAAKQTD